MPLESTTEDTDMSSIISDLEDVERQLGPEHEGGRGVFYSIQSALISIRSRLESHLGLMSEQERQPLTMESRETPPSMSGAITASGSDDNSAPTSCVGRLMERLRLAEFAHSACIPLDRLYAELSKRQHQATDDAQTTAAADEATTTDPLNLRSTFVSPSPFRRSSFLLASRRRVNAGGATLADQSIHENGLSLSRRGSSDSLEEGVEIVAEDAVDGVSAYVSDVAPAILLTEKSRSSLDLARQSVLFPDFSLMDDMDVDPPPSSSSTVVYSWGTGVNSLHDHSLDVALQDARIPADSPVGRADVVSIAVGEHHSACVTTTGQLLLSGTNTSGEVDPDRRNEQLIAKPVVLESLNQARIVQVSCGFNHTAALNSNCVVLTWGSNEFGQLGHQDAVSAHTPAPFTLFCRPAVMVLGPGHRATQVACGDGYTLCLTSRMSVLACGVQQMTGFASDQSNMLPAPVPALKYLPVVSIAAGHRHAVALTAHGSAFAWGDNSYGKCGRDHPKRLSVAMPIRTYDSELIASTHLPAPLTNWSYQDDQPSDHRHVSVPDDLAIVRASCGADTTILLTKSGKLLVCGRNNHGQLGLDPSQYDFIHSPRRVAHPISTRSFIHAEAGDVHTLMLDNMGDVWQMGGLRESEGCTQLLIGKGVRSIGAGGEHSMALSIRPGRSLPRREFSDATIKNDEAKFAECVEDLIRDLPGENQTDISGGSTRNATLKVITERAEELFRTPSVLNSLFIDPIELEDLFSKVLNVASPSSKQKIVSSIEKGIRKGLDCLRDDDSRLMWPEQVRFLLLYMQCPMFVSWKQEGSLFDRRGDLILSLCESILGIPYEGYVAFIAWATSVYTKEQFVRLLIQPLLNQLQKGLSVEAGAERRPIPAIVAVLRWLYTASERVGNLATPEDFYSDAITNMHPMALYKDLERYKQASKHEKVSDFFFCSNAFLISPRVKRNLLQMENEILMLKAAASTGLTYNPQAHALEFNAFYVLEIEREHLLKQTLQMIAVADPVDLRKKLRVVFKGEDGVDGKTFQCVWVNRKGAVCLTRLLARCLP
jgi:alpha-tubulin suppressor-like RCC1 family protein